MTHSGALSFWIWSLCFVLLVLSEPSSDVLESRPLSGQDGLMHELPKVGINMERAKALYEEALRTLSESSYKYDGESDKGLELLRQAASEYRYVPAIRALAHISLFGNFSNAPDFVLAKGYLEDIVNGDESVGMDWFYLAWIEEEGLSGEPRNPAKALAYLLSAILRPNSCPLAHMALAFKYSVGGGVPMNCHSASFHYYSATEHLLSDMEFSIHPGRSWPRVKLVQSGGGAEDEISQGIARDDLMQYYQLTAINDPEIQVLLGQLYFFGANGVDLDYSKALEYFELAAEEDLPISYGFLGLIYLHGLGVEPDSSLALQYFQRGVEQNHPLSWYGMGMMYLKGEEPLKRDMEEAVHCLTKAADQDSVDAHYQLAQIYLAGQSITSGLKKIKALNHLQYAASNGHLKALQNLGALKYLESSDLTCSEVKKYLKLISERVFGKLLHEAYKDYFDGHTSIACVKYMISAFIGFETAQSNAAYLLEQQETRGGYSRALSYWARAANQGDAYARVRTGDYYYYGYGYSNGSTSNLEGQISSMIDYSMAAQMYLMAENSFHPQAAFNLGYMYENGLGVPKDFILAKRYYDRAVKFNPKAWFPVKLALAKLYLKSIFLNDDNHLDISRTSDKVKSDTSTRLPEEQQITSKRKANTKKAYDRTGSRSKSQGFFYFITGWTSSYKWIWSYIQRILLSLLIALTIVHYVRSIVQVWRFGAGVVQAPDVPDRPQQMNVQNAPRNQLDRDSDTESQPSSSLNNNNATDRDKPHESVVDQEKDSARFISSRPLSSFYNRLQAEVDSQNQLRKRQQPPDDDETQL
jgi:SEL1 protein